MILLRAALLNMIILVGFVAAGLEDGHNVITVRTNLVRLCALVFLLVVGYMPMLIQTGRTIVLSDDMAQGLFSPIVAMYIVWEKRDVLMRPQEPGSFWSLAFVCAGALVGTAATLANSSTFSRLGFQFSLAGSLLLIGGWGTLRKLLFPFALLFFTFPIPDVLYGELTQPLQLLATRLSEGAFELMGFSVFREGNLLQLAHMKLSVVEACSGLRSLITLFFFCLVYGYFFEERWWLRAAIAVGSIPCAIIVNVLRITTTGVLGKYSLLWTEGIRHEIIGWVAVSIGFLAVLYCHRRVRAVLQPLTAAIS